MGGHLVLAAGILAGGLAASAAERSPFADAVAVWHMASKDDSAGKNSRLTVHGAARLGVALEGAQRAASLERGGDGQVAELEDGFLTAGQGAEGELNLPVTAASFCLRLRDPAGAWGAGLFSMRGRARNYSFFETLASLSGFDDDSHG